MVPDRKATAYFVAYSRARRCLVFGRLIGKYSHALAVQDSVETR